MMFRVFLLSLLLAPTAALADPFTAIGTIAMYASGMSAVIASGWAATLMWVGVAFGAVGADAARHRHRAAAKRVGA